MRAALVSFRGIRLLRAGRAVRWPADRRGRTMLLTPGAHPPPSLLARHRSGATGCADRAAFRAERIAVGPHGGALPGAHAGKARTRRVAPGDHLEAQRHAFGRQRTPTLHANTHVLACSEWQRTSRCVALSPGRPRGRSEEHGKGECLDGASHVSSRSLRPRRCGTGVHLL
ncbi:MAG TPA: hypothetical protein VG916_11920 [Gemmatimonadaceae bacterium]|nr:hypothetical protein [Gemmatimonadaceae bacterium]